MRTRRELFTTIRTEGGVLPPDLLARIAVNDRDIPGLDPESFGMQSGERIGEAIARSWNRLLGMWEAFRTQLAGLPETDLATSLTRERWLLPLFAELGYGRLPVARATELGGVSYAISHMWGSVPIHLLGWRTGLDSRSRGVVGAAARSPHGLVQEFLNRSDESLYGFVSNGRVLRLLRDSTTLTRQAYVEFDLEAMFTGEVYADFALLWLVCHVTRVAGEPPENCLLEQWRELARDQGVRALEALRTGVQDALTGLGAGFLAHPANHALREALRSGDLRDRDYYRELLRLVYRLIFLFVAEDRGLLFDPDAPEEARQRYLRYYSTSRLRRLAERRRGGRHGDLWESLTVVMRGLAVDAGISGLALPALGSFLWSRQAIPHLETAALSNDALLTAVRSLSEVRERGGVRRVVDYRNLGSEELGSVYESLLELHPMVDVEAARFELAIEAGHERKTTGSYYTPTPLVQSLLDTALEPVLDERRRAADPEAALLSVKVVDPASGSGHFLVAAAHRIARRLAEVRTGDTQPAPEALRHALRDVVSRCIYAVDANEMAVELCKVSLWLEALDPGRPLSFLDAHVKRGNSLIGLTPRLLSSGIPDGAYEARTLDDKDVCRTLAKRNRDERAQLEDSGPQLTLAEYAAASGREFFATARRIAALPDDTPEAIAAKEKAFSEITRSEGYRREKRAADAWCAAFFLPKVNGTDGVTTGTVRQLRENPESVSERLRTTIDTVAGEVVFFHWYLEFPDVFRVGDIASENPEAGWSGGFDVVLGNPPWERVKLEEKQFFAARVPEIAALRTKAARTRAIEQLKHDFPKVHKEFENARHQSEAELGFLHGSGRYPLCGRGDTNTYAVFAETMRMLVSRTGRVGALLPTGIATDHTTRHFFADLVERRQLISLYGFENREGIFPAVDSRVTFCLLTLAGAAAGGQAAEFCFFCHKASDLADADRRFTLSTEDFRLLNPNTRTVPIFRSRRDAELTKHLYRRVPVLRTADGGNPWRVTFFRMFDMANDSHLFRTRDELECDDFVLHGNIFVRGSERYLPLYEAKMVHHFDHRFGDYAMAPPDSTSTELPEVPLNRLQDPAYQVLPRYWVAGGEVEAKLAAQGWHRGWLAGWRGISNTTNERTVIAAIIPRTAVGHSYFLAVSDDASAPYLVTIFSSLIFDWVARQKMGGSNLTFFIMEQLPVLPPHVFGQPCPWAPRETFADWLRPRVLELTYTAVDLEPFARDLGYAGPPFRYDPERRALLRAEIDAAFFHLYLGDRDTWQREATAELLAFFPEPRTAAAYILDQFPIIKKRDEAAYGEYRTARLILDAYDRMTAAMETGERYVPLLDQLASLPAGMAPAGEHPAASPGHRPAEYAPTEGPSAPGQRLPVPTTEGPPSADHRPPVPTTEGPPSVVQPVVPAAPRTEPFAPTPELKVLPAPPPGQRFRPYVPIYDLAAAAGGFSGTQIPEPLGWAKAPRYRAVDPFMFIARVVGRSMEPLIPDGAWCLFRRAQPGSRNNKIVLVQCRDFTDPETGGSYTVKRYRSEKARTWDGSWRHTVIRLEPINPEFPPIVFRSGADIHVVAELLQVLTPEDY